ncbi:MAG: DUF2783 domain-containing protein [Proteobacteria bacterium]|nr:MAG: DUF2783 domain-containing protein [Pseudomonadota bacterium]
MNADIAEELRLRDPDAFYARLIELHDGLDADASNRLNASIILMMANRIGDDAALRAILDRAEAIALA